MVSGGDQQQPADPGRDRFLNFVPGLGQLRAVLRTGSLSPLDWDRDVQLATGVQLLLLAPALLAGCSSNQPAEPTVEPGTFDPQKPEDFSAKAEELILAEGYEYQAEKVVGGIKFRFYSDGDVELHLENLASITSLPFDLLAQIPLNDYTQDYGPVFQQALNYDFTGTTINVVVSKYPNTCVAKTDSLLTAELVKVDDLDSAIEVCDVGTQTMSIARRSLDDGLVFPVRDFVTFVSTNGNREFYNRFKLDPNQALVSNFLNGFMHQIFRAMGVQQGIDGNRAENEFVNIMEMVWLGLLEDGKLELPILIDYSSDHSDL